MLYTLTVVLLILCLLIAHAFNMRIPAFAQTVKGRKRGSAATPPRIRHIPRRNAFFSDAAHRRLQHRRRVSA